MTCLLGENNGQAKLTQDQVLQIYAMAWSGNYTQREIARVFWITTWCVSRIKLRKNWAWLTQVNGEIEMAVETKLTGKSMEQRIADRFKPSGDPRADHHAVHGTGPTRTHTFVHNSGHVVQPGTAARQTGPQEQRHHDSATTQGTGYNKGE